MNPTSASSTLRPRYLRTIAIGRYRSNFHSGTQVPSPDVRLFLEQAATRRRLWLLPGLHPQQQLQLVSLQCQACLIAFGPPSESPFRQAFLAQPKSARIVAKNFYRLRSLIPENE